MMAVGASIDQFKVCAYGVATMPLDWKGEFRILQVGLDNPGMMKLIHNENYKEEGLILIE